MSKNWKVLWSVVLFMAVSVFAGTPEEDFETLFGKEAKQAAASPNTKDQAAFAAKLLAGAKLVEEQKALQALLYEKAYDFGIKDPDGYPTALDAMNQLSTLDPNKAPQCQAKLLNVRQFRFSHTTGDQKKEAGDELVACLITLAAQSEQAGKFDESVTLLRRALETATFIKSDRKAEISDKLKTILSGQQSKKEFEALKARLAAEPKNATLRKSLVVACLGEFYNPEEAAKLLTDDLDAKFLTMARLALEKQESLSEQQLPELAGWYADLADKATPAAQGILWGHARTCCNRYLELHAAKDSDRLNVSMLLDRVDKGMAKVAAQAAKVAVATPAAIPATPEKDKTASLTGKEITLDLGSVKMKLVLIPAGKFMMGLEGRKVFDGPQHEVTISKPFYIGVYPVTQGQWRAVTGKVVWKGKDNVKENLDAPATWVSWDQANDFCKILTKFTHKTVRLPTEAEWEYACRAGTTTRFHFGDDESLLGYYAWYKNNAVDINEKYAHPVGQKKPNAWGLYDINGNVWQWCQDWLDENYYTSSSQTDPTGPPSGRTRVRRGGSWEHDAPKCWVHYRSSAPPTETAPYMGFRIVVQTDGK